MKTQDWGTDLDLDFQEKSRIMLWSCVMDYQSRAKSPEPTSRQRNKDKYKYRLCK
jgi:hypothetical protein